MSQPPTQEIQEEGQTGLDVQLTEQTSRQGRMTLVIQALQAIVGMADTLLQPIPVHVQLNWKTPVNYLTDNYPVVTIRVGNEDMTERVYGREIGGQRGHFVSYPFTLHVWGEKAWQLFQDVDQEDNTIPQVRNAADISDNIIDALEKFSGDTTSGIIHFYKVTARESEPDRGPKRLTRIIITGFIMVRRPLV